MPLEPRAYYNLLRYSFLKDPSFPAEPWQVEDLRKVPVEELFSRLQNLNVQVDKNSFLDWAEEYDTPEDLTFDLFKTADHVDQIYLLVFELWRRYLPEKVGLSLFCDELDLLIYLYEKGELESDENLQDALAALLDILDENLDLGADPQKLFISIAKYLGHDLEGFLYDYIFDQIEAGNDLYAEELIEDFYSFVKISRWFDFLRFKITAKKDIIEANLILKNLIEELEQKPELDLQMEILNSMVETGDPELFLDLAKKTLTQVRKKNDFLDLLEITLDYYRRLDLEHKEKELQQLLIEHFNEKLLEKEMVSSKSFLPDQAVKAFSTILSG